MNRVPDHYRGVWARTLLQTPQHKDTSTYVRWLQTGLWHADLRVPSALSPGSAPELLATQQGFCGITQVSPSAQGEVCTWHRKTDFQPPRPDVDAGLMVFETPERLIETGIHADYLEVWERLPDSTGRFIALGGLLPSGASNLDRLLVAGTCAMRVRPRAISWPEDTLAGQTMGEVILAHPTSAQAILDFEISFGRLEPDGWRIEHSTLPELVGTKQPIALRKLSDRRANVTDCGTAAEWEILEWTCADSLLCFA
jgi:hypothetical protein